MKMDAYLCPVQQHPSLGSPLYSACQHTLFHFSTELHHLRRGVRMADSDDILCDERTLIQVGCDQMCGSSDELDPSGMRLVIWFGTLEGREEGMMD